MLQELEGINVDDVCDLPNRPAIKQPPKQEQLNGRRKMMMTPLSSTTATVMGGSAWEPHT